MSQKILMDGQRQKFMGPVQEIADCLSFFHIIRIQNAKFQNNQNNDIGVVKTN